jgi:hypothetical protein
MKNILVEYACRVFFVCFLFLQALNGMSQTVSTTFTHPTDKDAENGTISIHGLKAGTTYQVAYKRNDTAVTAISLATDLNGTLVIRDLRKATYTDFSFQDGANSQIIKTTIKLAGTGIAVQTTKFFGAAYANFTGIQDDDPSGYAQFYARLSQPLNHASGISYKAGFWRRFLFARNFILQLTYGNTDNFKLYTYDTLGSRYANRLDLFSHSYFNGNLSLNLLTFVVPKNWKKNEGDMAHIYLDFFSSLAITNVIDTLKKNDPATSKSFNVKSNVFGLNLKAAFSNAFDTRFNIEVASRVLWLSPSSGSINSKLNPQQSDIPDLSNTLNTSKSLVAENNFPYAQFDVLVQYLTGNNAVTTTSNQDNNTISNSNIFLKYSYTTNTAKGFGKRYPNNYFQFQIGYALDISKLFYAQSPTKSDVSNGSSANP